MERQLVFYGETDEDGNATPLNRVCSLDGSGAEVRPGEGKVLKQADITLISCKVFELDNRDADAGAEVTPAPTVTAAANVFDVLRLTGWPPRNDQFGYNFRHDLGPDYFADPDEWRLVEYKFTLATGGPAWIEWRIKSRKKGTS